MDPASIIGTTSAAITFVETIVKIVSIAREVHDTATGELNEHKRLRDITSALKPGINTLIEKRKSQGPLSQEEDSLLRVAEQCEDVAARISHLLDRYQSGSRFTIDDNSQSPTKKVTSPLSIKRTMKVTLQILWDKPEAEGEEAELELINALLISQSSQILKSLDNQFTLLRQERLTDLRKIRNNLETTLLDISGKSNDIIKKINSMQCQLDQTAEDQCTWLGQINELQKLFEASHSTIEEIKCHRLLQSIAFEGIEMRQHNVGRVELAETTFEWMVKDETVPPSAVHLSQSFRDWLENGNGIFYISGKPGSGKSTLMNFLANHPETRYQLNKWAHSTTVIVASMFIWNLGSADQKNMDGVARTLLYNILCRNKELIPQVFAEIWNDSNEGPLDPQQHLILTRVDINKALQRLLKNTASRYRYCFFIDGLDEFYDENMPTFSFAAELKRWADHPAVKLCVSSREEQPWMNAFVKFPTLRLHLATKQDVQKMIEKFLSDDQHLDTFDSADSEKFISTFVEMADGIFIWVKLVLRELEEKLNYKLSLDELYTVLKEVPEGLDEFYARILLRIRSTDKQEAWAILDIMIEATEWDSRTRLSLYHYSLVKDLTVERHGISRRDSDQKLPRTAATAFPWDSRSNNSRSISIR
ncbi:hypothetical protein FNYG_15944 [Fusarium nygamai]|uniref:Nephrocystin 3-like N-terminal domain-containing protein n=1 Tax=Gibberella nygamai TaxID=42673 RepID=A0A2K0TYI1_GIBNY|nr:hypothetical protein FNYG_15944 [Fusarium nygamai]